MGTPSGMPWTARCTSSTLPDRRLTPPSIQTARVQSLRRGEHVVRDEHHGPAGVHARSGWRSVDFCAEIHVADRKNLVDEEHVRVGLHRHGKAEPREHAARIDEHGLIEKLSEFREIAHPVEPFFDRCPVHAEQHPAQDGVLPAGEVALEADANGQQRDAEARVAVDPAAIHRHDARQRAHERALARAIGTEHAEGLALANLEGHVAQRPEFLRPRQFAPQPVVDADVLGADDDKDQDRSPAWAGAKLMGKGAGGRTIFRRRPSGSLRSNRRMIATPAMSRTHGDAGRPDPGPTSPATADRAGSCGRR